MVSCASESGWNPVCSSSVQVSVRTGVCSTASRYLQNGADLIWIETEKPHIGQIAGMVERVREVIPNAKLVYNNSPSFNWTLNFRQQVFDEWEEEGKDVRLRSGPPDERESTTVNSARMRMIKSSPSRADAARDAGIFHHLITLPTYHTAALSTDTLSKEYFGELGMLGYVVACAARGDSQRYRLCQTPDYVGLQYR